LACTVVSWPTEEGISARSASVAGHYRRACIVAARRAGSVEQGVGGSGQLQGRPAGYDPLPRVGGPGPGCGWGAATKRGTRTSGSTSRVGLPSLTPERVGRFCLLLGRSQDHRGDFPLHSAPSRLVERPGDRILCVVWGDRQRQRPCSRGSHGHHDENDEPAQLVSAPAWWTGRRRSAPAKVGNLRTTPRRSG
jgi:hypothetical protein